MVRPEILPLTSLRFVAASLIVILHGGQQGLHHGAFQRTFAFSHGLTFFFILSGFILAYSYPTLRGAREIGRFWLSRISRIWPAAVVCTLLWAALLPWNLNGFSPSQNIAILFSNLFLVHSWMFSRVFSHSFNSVTWSLSAELFFYLVFPFILHILKIRWQWILLCLLSWIAIHLIFMVNIDLTHGRKFLDWFRYLNPTTRLFEFALGMLAYRLYTRAHKINYSPIFWTVIEVSILLLLISNLWAAKYISQLEIFHDDPLLSLGQYVENTGAAPSLVLLILVFARSKGYLSMALSHRLGVFLGKISFALYLIHYLFLHLYLQYLKEFSLGFSSWELNSVYWIACLSASYLLFTFVEEPCRRVMNRMGDNYLFGRSKSRSSRFSSSIPR